MYELFGARVSGTSVEFRLFLPDREVDARQYDHGGSPRITRVRVVGDFQPALGQPAWNAPTALELTRQSHANGWLYTGRIDALPPGYYQYKYFVSFENGTSRWCTDPCTRYVATEFENSGFVIGTQEITVEPLAQRLPPRDWVIYELMIDDFTAALRGERAPFDAIRDKLDDLQDLGVNAIEFMPWTAWRSASFSWGYDPFLFFSIAERYLDDKTEPLIRRHRLRRLINELHRRGIHVVMDGVFNHVSAGLTPDTGFPYHWLYEDPVDSPYTGGFSGGGFFEDLDYNNECTVQFIGDVCKYWLDTYQIDGIRFDYTIGFYQSGPSGKGIRRLIDDLNQHAAAQGRPETAFVLEHLSDNRYEAIDVVNSIDATGCWFDPLFFSLGDAAANERVTTSLMRPLDAARDFEPGRLPITYVENHDHSTLVNRVGGRSVWWKAQPAIISLLTAPGCVQLHNGQEFGDDYWLPEQGSDRVQSRPVHWNYANDEPGQRLRELHRRLIALRHESPALRSANFYPSHYDEQDAHFNSEGYGVDVDRGIVIFHRWGNTDDGRLERLIIVVNFSAWDQFVTVPFSTNGTWRDRLNDTTVKVSGFRRENDRIPSHWGRVYQRID